MARLWIVVFFSVAFCFVTMASQSGGCHEPAAAESRHLLLQKAKTWMYQLQDLDNDGAIQALARSEYPLLVVEPGHNQKDIPFGSKLMLPVVYSMPGGRS